MTSGLPSTRPSLLVRNLTLAALAVATIVAFAGVRDADWILFDDPAYVARNASISRGLTFEGLQWMLRHPHGGNFHPLTSLSHMLDCELFGLAPRGPHLVNLGLHVLTVLLACVTLARCTGAWWRSAAVAAVFALHPLRVESVAWISERKDVLSGVFFWATILAYVRWTERPTRARHAVLVVAFVLGLAAKPMLVTLPFLLLLLDVWPLKRAAWPLVGRGSAPRWREKWPLFVAMAVSIVVTFLVQRAAGAVMATQTLPLGSRVANALASYARYLGLTFAPHDLAIYYPLSTTPPVGLAAASLALLVVVTWLVWRRRDAQPALLVGWTWFLGTLVPVIGLVQVGAQAYADRYTYLPTIGVAIALVWLVADAVASRPAWRATTIAVFVAALVALGLATMRQVSYWKNTRTLFTRALEVTPPNAVALQNLGNALLVDGELDAAITCLEGALAAVPDFPDAENNLGTALGNKGRYEDAIRHFRAALRTENTAEIHQNLGWALAQSGRGDEAIPEYEAAIRIDPDFAAPRAKLGAALCARGRFEEAAVHLLRALEIDPTDVETHRSLAITRTLQGRVEEGVASYRKVLELRPSDLDALNNIAWIRATHAEAAHRDGAEAVRLAERARDLPHDPNHVLFSTLAAAYAEAGRFDDARQAAQRAVELARSAGDEDAVKRFTRQLDGYRLGRAWRN